MEYQVAGKRMEAGRKGRDFYTGALKKKVDVPISLSKRCRARERQPALSVPARHIGERFAGGVL